MADTLLPFVVYETGEAAEIRERESGEVIATHDTLRAALADLLDDENYKPRAPLLRTDGEPSGAWRWHDMTAVEDELADDGSQVTAMGISRMAARLNAGSPIMIDGGSDDSDAHASLSKTDTPANGWTHVGVEVVDPSGRLHLWGYSEVLPTIAAQMDSNRLAYGSIGFGTKSQDNDDARLYQHALTNIPAVDGLHPAGTPRAMAGIHFRTRRIDGRGESMSTKKTTARAEMRKLIKRGPALDKVGEIARALGVTPDDELGADSWESPTMDAFRALREMAKVEKILEGLAVVADETGPAEGARALRRAHCVRMAVRASEAFDSPEAQDAFDEKVIEALREVFASETAGPAELLDLLTASKAAFAAAVTEPPTEEPEEPEERAEDDTSGGAGDEGGNAEEDEMSKEDKARHVAELGLVTARAKTAEVELAKLREEKAEREASDFINAELAKRSLDLPEEPRRGLVTLAKRSRDEAMALLAAYHVPPQGQVFGRGGKVSSPTAEGSGERNDAEITKLAKKREREIRATDPKLEKHRAWSRAVKEVREEHPELFGDNAA